MTHRTSTDLVYLDTNVVNEFLKPNSAALNQFVFLKKEGGFRFIVSIDLLHELAIHPDPDEARNSLRAIYRLFSPHYFAREPKELFREELDSIFENKKPTYFAPRSEAEQRFDVVFNGVGTHRADELRLWDKNRKRELLADANLDFSEVKGLSVAPSISFPLIWERIVALRILHARIGEWATRLYQQSISENQTNAVVDNLDSLPLIKTQCLIMAAKYYTKVVQKSKPKYGDSSDDRHILMAALSNIFLTDDKGIQKLLRVADGMWGFTLETPSTFLQSTAVIATT